MQMRQGDWTWGDWGDNKDMLLIFNSWYYIAIQGMEKVALELGYTADAQKYQAFLKSFKASYNKQFWNGKAYRSPDYQGLSDDRVQALAVVSGLADASKYKALLKVFQTEEHASPYMEKYVFEAMMRMGFEEEAFQRHEKRFRKMVEMPGFTTLFEGWGIGGEGFGGGTVNHGWSGGGLVICEQYICGVAPIKPGFKEFQILPQPGNIQSAESVIPTIQGKINVRFSQDKSAFELKANVPAGCKSLMGVPARNYREIRINDQLVWKNGKYVSGTPYMQGAPQRLHIAFNCPEGDYVIRAVN